MKGWDRRRDFTRYRFGEAWSDDVDVALGRNGCNARDDVLRRDLTDVAMRPGTCFVQRGTLHDPYRGETIAFVRGPGTSDAVRIDHVVSLADASYKGARDWDDERRRDFANDPRNLLAVSAKADSTRLFAMQRVGCRPTWGSAASSSHARWRWTPPTGCGSRTGGTGDGRGALGLLAERDETSARGERIRHRHVVLGTGQPVPSTRRHGPPRSVARWDPRRSATGSRSRRRDRAERRRGPPRGPAPRPPTQRRSRGRPATVARVRAARSGRRPGRRRGTRPIATAGECPSRPRGRRAAVPARRVRSAHRASRASRVRNPPARRRRRCSRDGRGREGVRRARRPPPVVARATSGDGRPAPAARASAFITSAFAIGSTNTP